MALKGLHCLKSLEKPRMSFCRPKIKGKFLSDGLVSWSGNMGRPRDARNSINMGRAVIKIFALAQTSNLLLPVHIISRISNKKWGMDDIM